MSEHRTGIVGSFFAGIVRGLGFLLVFLFVPLIAFGALYAFLSGDDDVDFSGSKAKTDHAVGVVELAGEIGIVDDFRKELKRVVEDKQIKAIVVRIDSPGGGVGASEELYGFIKEADTKKPVVCALGSVAASGGLYAAQGCRKILTLRGTMTGSIGVIAMLPMFRDIMDKVGVSMNVVKSGAYKDVGSPFRPMTEEDRAFLKSLIDQCYEQFVDVIAKSRKLPVEEVKKFADGRIILGEQAVELKLVDGIGGVQDAAKLALLELGDEEEPEVIYQSPKSGLELLLSGEAATFVRELISQSKPRILYRAFL